MPAALLLEFRITLIFTLLSLIHQVRTEINKEIEAVSKAADPLKILASADTMKLVGVQRPLLQVRTTRKNIQSIPNISYNLFYIQNCFPQLTGIMCTSFPLFTIISSPCFTKRAKSQPCSAQIFCVLILPPCLHRDSCAAHILMWAFVEKLKNTLPVLFGTVSLRQPCSIEDKPLVYTHLAALCYLCSEEHTHSLWPQHAIVSREIY